MTAAESPVDAFLLLSFGGPRGRDEVMPFLRRVTAGRGVSDERLAIVAEHYYHFDGVSPITAHNEALLLAVRAELYARGFDLRCYLGNRNAPPFVTDTVAAMVDDGRRHALVLATSATGSYSSCRQYRDDLAGALHAYDEEIIYVDKLRHFFDHPGFIEANAAGVRSALAELPAAERDSARLVFTAHSIPVSMNETSGPAGGLYAAQHAATARLVAQAVRGPDAQFDQVWQSRSGPPAVPWLMPDISDHLATLAAEGVTSVVVCPTGFVSDHLEVIWDLDIEARELATSLGMSFVRAATAGTHPAFVSAIADLVAERITGTAPQSLSTLGLCGIDCPANCCPRPPSRPVVRR